MNGEVLLDTNIVIAFFAQEASILARIEHVNFLVPAIVLGELYAGARKSARVAENMARIDAMIPVGIVLSCDRATAQEYGLIKQALRAKGRPIPENDIWIAAIAQQYKLPLVTHDDHFTAVDGLTVEKW